MAVSERLNFAVVADVSGAARGMRNLSEVLKATIPVNEKLAMSGKKVEDMILQLEERLKTGKVSQDHYAAALAMLQDRQRAIQGQIDGTTKAIRGQGDAVSATAKQWAQFGKSDLDKFNERMKSLTAVRMQMSRQDFRQAFTKLRMEDPRIVTAQLAKTIVPPKLPAIKAQPMMTDDMRQALGQLPVVGRFMGTLGPATATVAAAGAAVGVLAVQFKLLSDAASYSARNIKAAFDEIDQISDTAELLGMTAQSLSLLQTQAALAEVDAGTLQGALQKLEVTLGDAMSGAAGSADKFERLGLDFRSLAQQSPDKQFAAVAAAISSLPTQAEKLNAVFDIFGRGNTKIAKMLATFQDLQEEAMKTGNVFTEEQRALMDKADAQMIRLNQTISGVWKQISIEVMPAVGRMAEAFADILGDPQVRAELVAAFSNIATAIEMATAALKEMNNQAEKPKGIFNSLRDSKVARGYLGLQASYFGLPGQIIGAAGQAFFPYSQESTRVMKQQQFTLNNLRKDANAGGDELSMMLDEQAAMFAQWDEWLNNTAERLKPFHAANDFIATLREEVDTLGMSRDQIEQMKIDRMELSDLQRAAIAGLLEEKRIKQEELDLEKEISDVRSKAFDEGARLRESLMSDEERLMKQAANFQQLVNLGALTRDEMGKLLFREAGALADGGEMPRTIKAGTVEAAKAMSTRRQERVESILEKIRENTDPKNQEAMVEFFGEGIA